MDVKLYNKTKELIGAWQAEARQAYIDGNQTKQAICHQYIVSGMEFLTLLETPVVPTDKYSRANGTIFEQMVPIGPHETVQKVYYDRNFNAKISTYRANADDREEFPAGKTG